MVLRFSNSCGRPRCQPILCCINFRGGAYLDSPHGSTPPDAPDRHANDRLDSWGEIATYLRRGIRTARRWEREEGLPVHRHLHRKSGSVYAFKSELDAWWNSRRPQLALSEEKLPSRWAVSRWWLLAITLVLGVLVVVWVRPLSSGRRTMPSKVRALAVLPFENLSKGPQGDVFADVMTEELITSLAQVMPLRVVPRNSVMRYRRSTESLRDIARELNVDAVVKGSIQQVGGRIRITVRLIDVRIDRHLWAGAFEGNSENIMAFQTKTVDAIANDIRTALGLGRPG